MAINQKIGIVGLGWLGESLADFLDPSVNELWGTVTSKEKAKRIAQKRISPTLWKSDDVFPDSLKQSLSETKILVLNLPPSVFKSVTYAEGLNSFIPYLNPSAKVIFTSSTGVYPNDLEDAREEYKFRPEESNKLLEAEQSLKKQLGDRLCILRLAGLIGGNRNPVHYLVKKEVNDNPNKKINLIHRLDILKIIKQVIEENHFGEIFNVCHPDHPTRKNYYTAKAQEFNLGKISFNSSLGSQKDKVVNCSKLQEKMNFTKFQLL